VIRKTRLAATFAFAAGLTVAGIVAAQTQTASAAPPAASPQAAPLPTQSALPWVHYEPPAIKPLGRDIVSQPTYSVDAPPDGPSGIYLPAVVLGYAKSATGCVVIGCDDGPQVGGAAATPSTGPAEPPPLNPGPSGPH
jgi:hypothetical protein